MVVLAGVVYVQLVPRSAPTEAHTLSLRERARLTIFLRLRDHAEVSGALLSCVWSAKVPSLVATS